MKHRCNLVCTYIPMVLLRNLLREDKKQQLADCISLSIKQNKYRRNLFSYNYVQGAALVSVFHLSFVNFHLSTTNESLAAQV